MKKINLNEESYIKLKNILINEISYGLVNRAYDKSEDMFYDVRTSFEDFYNTLTDATLSSRSQDGKTNPYLDKIKNVADVIYDIIMKKESQKDTFHDELNKVDDSKFYNSEESDENDIDNMDLGYLKKNYSS